MDNNNIKTNLGNKVVTRERVYSILSKAICRGDIKPGERLVESKLAKSFNISRTPVREAIIELKQKGLVVSSVPKGVTVAPIPTDFDIDEFYDVTKVLRGLSAKMAAKNIKKSEIEELKKIIIKSENCFKIGETNELTDLNSRFHRIIEKSSKNKELFYILDVHLKRLDERFTRIISNMRRQKKAIEEHQKILEAIENRNGELAESLMCEHINNAKLTLKKEIKGEIPIQKYF